MRKLNLPPRWGNIRLERQYYAPVMALDNNKALYVRDPEGGPLMLDLACDCGYSWTILASEFPGRRVLKRCGRPDCPCMEKPRAKRVREPSTVCSVSWSINVIQRIREYAKQHGLSFSRASEDLATEGLVQKLVDDKPPDCSIKPNGSTQP